MARLLALTLVALAAAPAAWAAPAAAARAPAGARLVACRRSPSIEQRVAVVGTWMRPIAGGRRLALRIDLWERTPGQRWAPRSDVPGLGEWIAPRVGSHAGDVFKYRQAVGRLDVRAAYRFRVTFRWLGPDGAVVREATRTTAACREPDLRPDLVLRSVTTTDDGRYVVRVRNQGRGAVGRFDVGASFPGDAEPWSHTRGVRGLAPGQSARVVFTGPCESVSFLADPANVIEEADETNNALSADCRA